MLSLGSHTTTEVVLELGVGRALRTCVCVCVDLDNALLCAGRVFVVLSTAARWTLRGPSGDCDCCTRPNKSTTLRDSQAGKAEGDAKTTRGELKRWREQITKQQDQYTVHLYITNIGAHTPSP